MMQTILSYLSTFKLSLEQWLLVCLTVALGALVVAFRLQGGQLHAAQVNLLGLQINDQEGADENAVAKAKKAYETAFDAYRKAKQ